MTHHRISRSIIYLFFAIFCVIMIFPFVWMVLLSFKTRQEINTANSFFPKVWTIVNYINVFTRVPIANWFKNSVIVTVFASAAVLFTSSLVGFVFAKFEFPFKKIIFWFILATMMIPAQVTMIPSFILITGLGLYNTLLALIIPRMIGGFGIFLCKQFIEDVPDSLCEAAYIDGAGPYYIYFRIIIHLIRPAIGALSIFMFLEFWNDYMNPLLYINDPENMTMSLAITFFASQRASDLGAILAAATLVMLPVTIIFFIFQKQFIKGIAITGIK